MRKAISIDPGNEKCGVLLVDIDDLVVMEGRIVKKNYVIELIDSWYKLNYIDFIILGNGTTSEYWEHELTLHEFSSVILVDETNTTLRAKDRILELKPQKFFLETFLKTLLSPPPNLDSVAALILIEDYLGKKLKWQEVIDFKIWP